MLKIVEGSETELLFTPPCGVSESWEHACCKDCKHRGRNPVVAQVVSKGDIFGLEGPKCLVVKRSTIEAEPGDFYVARINDEKPKSRSSEGTERSET